MKKNYNKLWFLLCILFTGMQANATQVTVQVSNFVFTPSNINVLVGDTVHFVWVSGSHTTTCDGSSGTSLPLGAATWGSNMNSSIQTFDYPVTVAGAYHYVCLPHAPGMSGNITATLPPIITADITFSVDLSQTSGVTSPHLTGSFNGWSATATPMTDMGSGIYQATVSIDTTLTVQYTFLKDSSFNGQEAVPAACGVSNGFGGFNRELVVPENDATLTAVCYSSCAACIPPGYADITFSVDLSQTSGVVSPHLTGSFNGWSATATPMTDMGSGIYQATVNIDTSFTVQYTFLKDSSFNGQESVPAACGVSNGFGGFNRELIIPENDSTLATVCYSSCAACLPPGYADITFSVDLSQTSGVVSPHLTGSFNGWSATATPMTDMGSGIYQATVNIDTSFTVQYTFLKDSSFNGQEAVPAACGVSNGFGGYNRELVVPENDSTLATVCYSSCAACIVPVFVDVNFYVDMTNEPAVVSPHLTGSFNGWSTTAILMNDLGGNIYQATVSLDTSLTVQYIFLKDSSFTGQENVPPSCGVSNGFGGFNRELVVPESNANLPVVCYSSCGSCVLNPGTVNVLFRVDLSQDTICGGGPHIAGSFNGWSATATPLDSIGNGIYQKTLQLDTSMAFEYKFLKDSMFSSPCGDESIPAACSVNGNRGITVPVNDTILPVVCFSSCTACTLPNDSVDVTFRVDLSQEVICAGGPHIAGSFNGWNTMANPLDSIGNGIYQTTLHLESTQTYEYKFLKDSDWTCGGENVPGICNINGNRQIIVPDSNIVLDVVCFGSCTACVPPPATANVTFRCDFTLTTLCANGPHIAGTFNNWTPAANAMTLVTGGIYEATFTLDVGDTAFYKFLKDNDWSCGDETVPAACGTPNGNGGYNRYFVPQGDTTLEAVCFSSCLVCPNGINDFNNASEISVYPNPTENIIYVSTATLHGNFDLNLLSMDGRVLVSKKINAGYQQTIAIDMQSFAKGIYTLKVDSDKGTSYQKVILK